MTFTLWRSCCAPSRANGGRTDDARGTFGNCRALRLEPWRAGSRRARNGRAAAKIDRAKIAEAVEQWRSGLERAAEAVPAREPRSSAREQPSRPDESYWAKWRAFIKQTVRGDLLRSEKLVGDAIGEALGSELDKRDAELAALRSQVVALSDRRLPNWKTSSARGRCEWWGDSTRSETPGFGPRVSPSWEGRSEIRGPSTRPMQRRRSKFPRRQNNFRRASSFRQGNFLAKCEASSLAYSSGFS